MANFIEFEKNFKALERYHSQNGHSHVGPYEDQVLHQWCLMMRNRRKKKITPEQIGYLKNLGFAWSTDDYVWQRKLQSFKSGDPDGGWCSRQRLYKKKSMLSHERIKALNDAGFIWEKLKENEKNY